MKPSHSPHPLSLLCVALCVLALALTLYPAITSVAGTSSSGPAAAWERARESGAYRFTADVRQTITPKPTVLNVGRTSKEQSVHLEGETNLPDSQLHLTLWSQGGSVLDASSGVEIKVEGGRAYARQGARDWEEINDFTSLFAPQGDFMAFLSAAKDVRQIPNPQSLITTYAFRIDGRSYARYLRDQMEKHLAEQGELPPGVTLDLPKQYVDMTGDGELWVDDDGLPLRQILRLHFPPRSDDQEIHAQVTVDFDFGGVGSREQGISHASRLTFHVSRFTLHLASSSSPSAPS